MFRWRGGLMAGVAVLVLALARPTLPSYLLGLILGLLGESLRFWAIGHSRGHTRGLTVEAPFVATSGPYAHSRHPLYVGNSLNALAVAVAAAGGHGRLGAYLLLGLTLVSLIGVYGTIIPLEEACLAGNHCQTYETYRKQVNRFWPSLRPRGPAEGYFCLDAALYFERWSVTWWVLIWLWLGLRLVGG
ncbi:MAG: DUF1295 domain-containing protein [Candidatus Eremiobacteraeota bacterium]|nr:DUF1295 domain-containing protein [Candidatus Eremiobacteraeota bacterium]